MDGDGGDIKMMGGERKIIVVHMGAYGSKAISMGVTWELKYRPDPQRLKTD